MFKLEKMLFHSLKNHICSYLFARSWIIDFKTEAQMDAEYTAKSMIIDSQHKMGF